MNNKLRVGLHLLAQILAQAAVAGLVPSGTPEKVFAAVVAVIGVLVAYFDTTSGLVAASKNPSLVSPPPVSPDSL